MGLCSVASHTTSLVLPLSKTSLLVFHQIWGVFSHYFFKCSFCSFLFLSGIPIIRMLVWSVVSQMSLSFYGFFFFSFLFLRLDNINWPTLKFADSFFFLLKSDIEPLKWKFHFNYRTFEIQISVRLIKKSFHLLIIYSWWDIVINSFIVLCTWCLLVLWAHFK